MRNPYWVEAEKRKGKLTDFPDKATQKKLKKLRKKFINLNRKKTIFILQQA